MRQLVVRILVLAAVVAAAIAGSSSARAGQGHAIVVTFQKQLVDPVNFVFEGTTGGAVKGHLESRIVPGSLTIHGPIWTFTFDWIVTANAPAKSFVARTTGTFDTTTGAVVMEGVVTSGWQEGAAVRERGQLVDAATFAFAGTIAILPGHSG
jgi:hypothetical protein